MIMKWQTIMIWQREGKFLNFYYRGMFLVDKLFFHFTSGSSRILFYAKMKKLNGNKCNNIPCDSSWKITLQNVPGIFIIYSIMNNNYQRNTWLSHRNFTCPRTYSGTKCLRYFDIDQPPRMPWLFNVYRDKMNKEILNNIIILYWFQTMWIIVLGEYPARLLTLLLLLFGTEDTFRQWKTTEKKNGFDPENYFHFFG